MSIVGVSPEEAAHALMPAFVRHKKYVEVLEMDSLLAYGNTVSNYYDCVFDAYDFPSVSKKEEFQLLGSYWEVI